MDIIRETAQRVAEAQRAPELQVDPEAYISDLKFGLVEVVYEWARGMVRGLFARSMPGVERKRETHLFFFL